MTQAATKCCANKHLTAPAAETARITGHQGVVLMFYLRDKLTFGALSALILAGTQAASAEEARIDLFKVITIKDEIVIGLSADELKALGGADASAVAHALAQKGDLTVWQYNVHRGSNGELQQAPTARIGLLAHASLRVEPYTTPYQVMPHP